MQKVNSYPNQSGFIYQKSERSGDLGVGKSVKSQPVLYFIGAVFCFFLLWHLFIPWQASGDDGLLFLGPFHQEAGGSYWRFLKMRYTTWSSRWLIEAVTVFLVNHVWLWRICNAGMMTIASCLPAYFFKEKEAVTVKDVMVSVGLLGLMPLTFFNETGWIATNTNYLWVYALLLVALYPICRFVFFKEQVSKPIYLISALSLVYASNQEQGLAILWASYLLVVLFFWHQWRQLWLWWSVNIGLLIVQTILILRAPGNYIRFEQEVAEWFPDFSKLTLLQKLSLGYTSTLKHLFFDHVWLVGVFLIVILIRLYVIRAQNMYVFGWFPFVTFLSMAFSLGHTENNGFPQLLASFNIYGTTSTLSDITTWYPDIILTLLYLSVGVALLYRRPKHEQIFILLVYLAVLCVRMLMGFSPTIWASATRTYIFSYGGIQLITCYILSVNQKRFDALGIPALIFSLGLIHWLSAFGIVAG